MRQKDDPTRRLLDELESNPDLSQRALAGRLGVSLGTVNQRVRHLLRERWISRVRVAGQRTRHVVTEDGAAARDRMSREHLASALTQYGALRDRVRHGLAACAGAARVRDRASAVAVYGVGDVAQIAFACAADLGVRLVGFIDDAGPESFLGLPVRAPGDLATMALDGHAFDRLLVASLVNHDAIRGRLQEVGFPLERVNWL